MVLIYILFLFYVIFWYIVVLFLSLYVSFCTKKRWLGLLCIILWCLVVMFSISTCPFILIHVIFVMHCIMLLCCMLLCVCVIISMRSHPGSNHLACPPTSTVGCPAHHYTYVHHATDQSSLRTWPVSTLCGRGSQSRLHHWSRSLLPRLSNL